MTSKNPYAAALRRINRLTIEERRKLFRGAMDELSIEPGKVATEEELVEAFAHHPNAFVAALGLGKYHATAAEALWKRLQIGATEIAIKERKN